MGGREGPESGRGRGRASQRKRKSTVLRKQRLRNMGGRGERVVESRGRSCLGGEYAGAGVGVRCGSGGGGGLLTAWRKTTAARGRQRRREPSERRSHRRAATRSRTPNPADHQADRAARPTAFSVRRESQLTCVDVVGQFDFQLQSAACSCCSTPASASRRTNLSMMPVKPMVPKKSTPPVQKVETWATFEPPSPPEENLHLIRCKHKYRSSTVLS